MGQPGEIITFQVGNYANFVGAHFFNLQDPHLNPEHETDFCHRVFWREGQNFQRQKILTPRVLMFDLKDNWGNAFIRNSNDVSEPGIQPGTFAKSNQPVKQNRVDQVEKNISWDGKVQTVVLRNDSSDSDEDLDPLPGTHKSANAGKKKVKLGPSDFSSWGEYAKWRLHNADKAAFRIPNYMYNAGSEELVSYGQGLDVYNKIQENVEDGIRHYAEDCDHLEGFHMLVDEYDGFTGIAGGILEHLGDEYDKKACLGLGLNHPFPDNEKWSKRRTLKEYKIRISNTAQLWGSFTNHSRVFSSLGVTEDIFSMNPSSKKFTSVVQDCTSPYISSAILAAALDSLSSPYRLHSPSFPLHEMTSVLNAFGHKMTIIGSSTPFPMGQQTLFSALNKDGFSSLNCLTPNVSLDLDTALGNVFVTRGINQDHVMSKSECREYKHADINSVTSCLELFCQESYPRSVHVIKNLSNSFKMRYPFPKLYDDVYLDTHSTKKQFTNPQVPCWFLPALTTAHNTPGTSKILERLISTIGGGTGGSAMKLKTFYEPSSATCNSSVVEFEDFADCVTELCSLKDTYSAE
ncbi:Protein misato 1 [Orchesella cincta]|uniref:Protein misato 1 n=1 Tax=Orchesella cincta TaxID=48709 RepID=A0A1D2NE71_ORCCI|nr:Protein misato 1 [Orchesella cincta]